MADKKKKEFKPYLMFDYVDAAGVPERAYKEVGFKELSKGSTESDDIIILGGGIGTGALPIATEGSYGVVELATSGENAANVVVQGNDSRINVVTTKGDIYGCSGTNTPARQAVGANRKFLVADSTASTGLAWKYVGGLSGDWIYGDGADGDLTLVADTVLSDDDNWKNYNDVDCAGYNLRFHANNFFGVFYINGTLDGNGGYFSSWARGAGVPGAGITSAGAASGGDGGYSSAAVYVYAATAADITVSAEGRPGVAGEDAPAPTTSNANAAGNAATGTVMKFRGTTITTTQAGGGAFTAGAGVVSTGGAAGTVTTANRRKEINCSKSIMELLFPLTESEFDANTSGRSSYAAAGGGGTNGGGDNAAAYGAMCGGGGGGGGSGLHGNGGAGKDGVLATAPDAAYACPGGGGGGGGGGEGTLVTDDGSNAVVNADGGDGGNGGGSGGFGSEGGAGGPGGGGIGIGVGPGITVTAAAGSVGTGGVNGSAAVAGKAYNLTR